MNKKIVYIALCVMAVMLHSCTSTAPKNPDLTDAWINQANKKLEKCTLTGFGYKSARMPDEKWHLWAQKNAPLINSIMGKLSDDYKLTIIGHTDARGPEVTEGNKPGNLRISADRAKTVYAALTSNGVNADKLHYKGVGSAEPIPGLDPGNGRQRRVTFKILPN